MSKTKNDIIEKMEKNRKWTTLTCLICGEKFKKSYTNWEKEIESDFHYCLDCIREERGHKDHS
jgi:hypothetical protein